MMQESKIGGLKILATAALAHLLASAVFIFITQAYSKWHQGKEAWSALLLALAIAFGLESLLLLLVLRLRMSAAFLSVLLSWTAGIAGFLALDVFAGSPLKQAAPLVSWLASLIILSMMIKRSERKYRASGTFWTY